MNVALMLLLFLAHPAQSLQPHPFDSNDFVSDKYLKPLPCTMGEVSGCGTIIDFDPTDSESSGYLANPWYQLPTPPQPSTTCHIEPEGDGCNSCTVCEGPSGESSRWCSLVYCIPPHNNYPEPPPGVTVTNCPNDLVLQPDVCHQVDIPAVPVLEEEAAKNWCAEHMTTDFGLQTCLQLLVKPTWTCTDKRRVLLTSEDGAKHCILFQ